MARRANKQELDPINEEEIVALGSWVQITLTSSEFNRILNDFDNSTVKMMLETKPQDKEEREKLFAVVHGMREFIAFMQNYVVEKDHIQNPQPSLDPTDDPRVHDIYR